MKENPEKIYGPLLKVLPQHHQQIFNRSIAHSALFFPFEKDSCKRL
jgi:hypothetical protein